MAKNKARSVSPHENDDTVVYKVMAAVVAACAGICALIRVKAVYSVAGSMMRVYNGLLWGVWICAALAVVCGLACALLRRRKGWCYVLGFVCAVSLLSCVSCLALRIFWIDAASGCYYLWVAAALLYSLYLLYQREFFVVALLTAAAGAVFYMLSRIGSSALSIAAVCVLFALSILATVLTFLTARADGKLHLGKRTFQLFNSGFAPLPLYLASALWPLCAIAALILGSAFAYYCIYAAIGCALIAVCYYTIKLM